MTTRFLLVTSCLVAMATLVAPQCSQVANRTKESSFDVKPSEQLGNGVGLILGIGGCAFLVALVFILVRSEEIQILHRGS